MAKKRTNNYKRSKFKGAKKTHSSIRRHSAGQEGVRPVGDVNPASLRNEKKNSKQKEDIFCVGNRKQLHKRRTSRRGKEKKGALSRIQ